MFKKITLLTLLGVSSFVYANNEPSIIFHNSGQQANASNQFPIIKFEKMEVMPPPKVESLSSNESKKEILSAKPLAKKVTRKLHVIKSPVITKNEMASKPIEELTSIPRKDWAMINGEKKVIQVSQPLMTIKESKIEVKPVVSTPRTEKKENHILVELMGNLPWFNIGIFTLTSIFGLGLLFSIYRFFSREKEDELLF